MPIRYRLLPKLPAGKRLSYDVRRPVPESTAMRLIALLLSIESRLTRIMTFWFVLAMLASAIRIVASPIHGAPDLSTFAPYALLVGAPLVSMGLALFWFRQGDRLPQPAFCLALAGRWRKVSREEAQDRVREVERERNAARQLAQQQRRLQAQQVHALALPSTTHTPVSVSQRNPAAQAGSHST